MNKALITILVLIMFIGAAAEVNAQVSRAGVIFLLLPPGARASGMGDAFTSIADDATSTYWNPAGLGRYPLSPAWFEYPNDSGEAIREIAIMGNGMPDANYRKYDTWALLGNRLARFDGSNWVFGEKYYPSPGENSEDIARRFSGIDDEDSLAVLKAKLAAVNNIIEKSELVNLTESISGNVPSDYAYAEDVEYSLETLISAWDELTIDKERFRKLQEIVNEALSDSSLNTLELDKITFGVNNAVKLRLPEDLYIPYNFILPDTITTLASDTKDLWVGTPSGLYKYNGKRWRTYTLADSMVSDDITAITFGKRQEIWIGTSNGISRFHRRKWFSYSTEDGLPGNRIIDFAVGKGNEVWVATDKGLAKFESNNFKTETTYPMNVGEDFSRVAAKYLHLKPGPARDAATVAIKEYNAFGDSLPETGTSILLPYSLAIKGEINSLHFDGKNNLWVATSKGLLSYNGESWDYYGYSVYTAKQNDTAESIVRTLLGDKAGEDKVNLLTNKIAEFNDLDNQSIEAGDIIYVYTSPLASEIKAVDDAGGDRVLIGTRHGTFQRAGDEWKRYVHAGLEKDEVIDIIQQDGEIWFATNDKLIINAHAKREMSFMHSNWLVQLADDIYFEYLSYVQHFDGIGTLGGAVTFLSYGSQERTDEWQQSLGTFASYEFAVGLSYGASVRDNLSLGMSAKYIHSHLSDVGAGREKGEGVASSFAVDGGMLWNTPVRRLDMGLTITNIGPDISYIDAAQADPLPRNLTLGLAYRLIDNPYNKLTIIGEASKQLIDLTKFNRDGLADKMAEKIEEIIAHVGAEYWYGTFLALRGGFVNDKTGQQRYFTLGAGLQYSNYRFDFSYIPSTNEDFNRLGNTMRFSMTARF